MSELKPHAANVPGDFYVEDGCCAMCDVPFTFAPDLFGEFQNSQGSRHCYVKRQPQTPSELSSMLDVIQCAELECIRYRGGDRQIQLDLVDREVGNVCDNLAPDLQERVDALMLKRNRPWWKF
ncbi:MAG: hypothetical protein JNG89_20115 [Planctomycetaceae bacterium]|nr:hypothetical protein [Planctomycetaceae bacterium]